MQTDRQRAMASVTAMGNDQHGDHRPQECRPEGPACVFAIGTAFPAHTIQQSTYPDKLFSMCGIDDDESLKAQFKYYCDTSCVDKRHTVVTSELVAQHPELVSDDGDASLSTRVAIANRVIPELAVEAARNAVHEWGRPLSAITHMVLATTTSTSVPGVDVAIARALNLTPTVERISLYSTGFSGGGAVLRVGRLVAQSARDARVLVIAVEANSIMTFRKPSVEAERQPDGFSPGLWVHSTLGDGAAALIIGCEPRSGVNKERTLFEIYKSIQMTIPNTEHILRSDLSEEGLLWKVHKQGLSDIIAQHLLEVATMGRDLLGTSINLCDLFWVVHPGAYLILEAVQKVLGLEKNQLQPSYNVLRHYGNCSSPTILFVLNEMQQLSKSEDGRVIGKQCEWGLSVAFGPGFTVEVSVLRSISIA